MNAELNHDQDEEQISRNETGEKTQDQDQDQDQDENRDEDNEHQHDEDDKTKRRESTKNSIGIPTTMKTRSG